MARVTHVARELAALGHDVNQVPPAVSGRGTRMISEMPMRCDQAALIGLRGRDANEIERARISMMAMSSKAPSMGRIQMRKTNFSKSSLSACNARPVHTDGP